MNRPTLGLFGESRRLLDQQPIEDWSSFQRGERVEVWSTDAFRFAAHVDDRADDGRVIWVIEHGTGCRRLFVRDDPVTIYSI